MSLTVNLYYHGQNGSARKFAEEMEANGVAQAIREEDGNLSYEYFQPLADPETIFLIDSWESQEALDVHHASPMMGQLAELREKYDLHMSVERYVSAEEAAGDEQFIRK
jgi:quinol monooxygenase YgiN